MAVYTHVGGDDLARLLADYELGTVSSFQGVEQGVDNTNYILTTDRERFVLTLFEKRVAEKDLPFFMAAMAHLADRGAPVPQPIEDRSGRIFKIVCEHPAVIVSFLEGRQRLAPTVSDCAKIGASNAQLHQWAAGFPVMRPNDLSLAKWRAIAEACAGNADQCAAGLGRLISDELAYLERNWPSDLPRGLVHADLFPDNVFFDDGGAVSGIIDFYFACTDLFAYDLALTLNAWATTSGVFDHGRAGSLMVSYELVRQLTDAERVAMATLLRGAALRILLTRLHDFLHRVDGAVVAVKDPLEYRDLLLFHRTSGPLPCFRIA